MARNGRLLETCILVEPSPIKCIIGYGLSTISSRSVRSDLIYGFIFYKLLHHPWPTKYTAIYVPEKAIKQEGQFLYFILS